jgi:plasmid stabilization system protein ParE
MSSYALTPPAWGDISEIWHYIAQDNTEAADRVEQAIYDACKFVAESPLRGHTHKELTSRNIRFWTLTGYSNYCVMYKPDTSPLRIIAILHGKRNILQILKQRQ